MLVFFYLCISCCCKYGNVLKLSYFKLSWQYLVSKCGLDSHEERQEGRVLHGDLRVLICTYITTEISFSGCVEYNHTS